MNSITDELDREYAPAWRPDPGDKLIGIVVAIDDRDGGYGPYKILTIRQDDGEELAWHAMHDVAKSKVAEENPKVDDQIGAKYRGFTAKQDASGKYHDYALVVKHVAPDDDGTAADAAPDDESPVAPVGAFEKAEAQKGDGDDIPF